MTVSDMPLASATRDQAGSGALCARVRAHARARLTATVRDGNPVARALSVVAGDVRSWWLVAARPASLRAWLRACRVEQARVPDGSGLLRGLWLVDNVLLGGLLLVGSVAAYLAAGGLRWLAGHPARRWPALLAAGALIVWWAAT